MWLGAVHYGLARFRQGERRSCGFAKPPILRQHEHPGHTSHRALLTVVAPTGWKSDQNRAQARLIGETAGRSKRPICWHVGLRKLRLSGGFHLVNVIRSEQ